MQVGVHLRQHHQVVYVHRGEQFADRERIATALLECVGASMCGGADRSAGQAQATFAQFVLELFGMGREIAERAQFDCAET